MNAVGYSNTLNKDRVTRSKTLSHLESLPLELIEKVFLNCLNVSLPRASPYLAAAVSNERVYKVLILLAFWDIKTINKTNYEDRPMTKSARYKCAFAHGNRAFDIRQILRPLGRGYVPLSVDERRILQSDVLRCRWCTVDRIQGQLPNLAKLIIIRWCINYGYRLKENECQELEDLLQREQFERSGGSICVGVITRKVKRPGRMDEEERPQRDPEDEYCQDCRVYVQMGEFIEIKPCNDSLEPIWFSLLNLTEIPSFLFRADVDSSRRGLARGSFTITHQTFLTTLLYSGQLLTQMRFQSYGPNRFIAYSQNSLQKGIHIALTTTDPFTLDILLKFDEALGRDPLQSEFIYMIPSDHFRTAAQAHIEANPKYYANRNDVGDNNEDLDSALMCFCLLLYSSFETIPYDDPVIGQFAEDVGGAFGEWLLDFVMNFPQHMAILEEDHMEHELFYEREPNKDTELGLRYIREVVPSRITFSIPIIWMKDNFFGLPLPFGLGLVEASRKLDTATILYMTSLYASTHAS